MRNVLPRSGSENVALFNVVELLVDSCVFEDHKSIVSISGPCGCPHRFDLYTVVTPICRVVLVVRVRSGRSNTNHH